MDDLIALMQAGDTEALDRLARQGGARLLAVARRCCRSPHDAEDAVQQALVNASASMRGYRGDGSPLAWLSTLVARSCFRMNAQAHNDPARTSHDDVDPCTCDDPAVIAERAQLELQLSAALMTLSRTDRLAFLLAAEGASSDEIAARFAMTSDAVRSRLKRARRKLRDLLAAQGVTHNDGAPAPVRHEAPRRPHL